MGDYIFNYDQYKKSINRKNNFNFSLLIFLIIILLGLCFFIYPNKTKKEEFYFVEIANFQTYNKANKLANEIHNSGGAGYVYFDGTYHVLASFYSNYSNAETVSNNLKTNYENVTIFTIETNKFSQQKNLTTNQNDSIKNLLNTCYKIILNLEELNTKLDKNNLSLDQLNLHIKNHQKEFDDVYSNFVSNFQNNSKFNIAKNYLSEMKNSFNNLSNLNSETASKTLRYETIKLIVKRSQFASCF